MKKSSRPFLLFLLLSMLSFSHVVFAEEPKDITFLDDLMESMNSIDLDTNTVCTQIIKSKANDFKKFLITTQLTKSFEIQEKLGTVPAGQLQALLFSVLLGSPEPEKQIEHLQAAHKKFSDQFAKISNTPACTKEFQNWKEQTQEVLKNYQFYILKEVAQSALTDIKTLEDYSEKLPNSSDRIFGIRATFEDGHTEFVSGDGLYIVRGNENSYETIVNEKEKYRKQAIKQLPHLNVVIRDTGQIDITLRDQIYTAKENQTLMLVRGDEGLSEEINGAIVLDQKKEVVRITEHGLVYNQGSLVQEYRKVNDDLRVPTVYIKPEFFFDDKARANLLNNPDLDFALSAEIRERMHRLIYLFSKEKDLFGNSSIQSVEGIGVQNKNKLKFIAKMQDGSQQVWVALLPAEKSKRYTTVDLYNFQPETFEPIGKIQYDTDGFKKFLIRRDFILKNKTTRSIEYRLISKRKSTDTNKWVVTFSEPEVEQSTLSKATSAVGHGLQWSLDKAQEWLGSAAGFIFSPFQTAMYLTLDKVTAAASYIPGLEQLESNLETKAFRFYTNKQARFIDWYDRAQHGGFSELFWGATPELFIETYREFLSTLSESEQKAFQKIVTSIVEKDRKKQYGETLTQLIYNIVDMPINDQEASIAAVSHFGFLNLSHQFFAQAGEMYDANRWGMAALNATSALGILTAEGWITSIGLNASANLLTGTAIRGKGFVQAMKNLAARNHSWAMNAIVHPAMLGMWGSATLNDAQKLLRQSLSGNQEAWDTAERLASINAEYFGYLIGVRRVVDIKKYFIKAKEQEVKNPLLVRPKNEAEATQLAHEEGAIDQGTLERAQIQRPQTLDETLAQEQPAESQSSEKSEPQLVSIENQQDKPAQFLSHPLQWIKEKLGFKKVKKDESALPEHVQEIVKSSHSTQELYYLRTKELNELLLALQSGNVALTIGSSLSDIDVQILQGLKSRLHKNYNLEQTKEAYIEVDGLKIPKSLLDYEIISFSFLDSISTSVEDGLKKLNSVVEASKSNKVILYLPDIYELFHPDRSAGIKSHALLTRLKRVQDKHPNLKIIYRSTEDSVKPFKKEYAIKGYNQKSITFRAYTREQALQIVIRQVPQFEEKFSQHASLDVKITKDAIESALDIALAQKENDNLVNTTIEKLQYAIASAQIKKGTEVFEVTTLKKHQESMLTQLRRIEEDLKSHPENENLLSAQKQIKTELENVELSLERQRKLVNFYTLKPEEQIKFLRDRVQNLEQRIAMENQDAEFQNIARTLLKEYKDRIIQLETNKNQSKDHQYITADDVRTTSSITFLTQLEIILDLPAKMKKILKGAKAEAEIHKIQNHLLLSLVPTRKSNKPRLVILLAGITGAGKTEFVKQVNEALYPVEYYPELYTVAEDGKSGPLLQIDLGIFSEKHSLTSLTGSSHGYVGFDKPTLIEKHHARVKGLGGLLFDEVDKVGAVEQFTNMLYKLLDEGVYETVQGDSYPLNNMTVSFTANWGQDPLLAFVTREINGEFTTPAAREHALQQAILEARKEVEQKMPAAFRNRLQEIIIVAPLDIQTLKEIVLGQVEVMKKNTIEYAKKEGIPDLNLDFKITDKVAKFILDRREDPRMQARDIGRAFAKHIQEEIIAPYFVRVLERTRAWPKNATIALDIVSDVVGNEKIVIDVYNKAGSKIDKVEKPVASLNNQERPLPETAALYHTLSEHDPESDFYRSHVGTRFYREKIATSPILHEALNLIIANRKSDAETKIAEFHKTHHELTDKSSAFTPEQLKIMTKDILHILETTAKNPDIVDSYKQKQLENRYKETTKEVQHPNLFLPQEQSIELATTILKHIAPEGSSTDQNKAFHVASLDIAHTPALDLIAQKIKVEPTKIAVNAPTEVVQNLKSAYANFDFIEVRSGDPASKVTDTMKQAGTYDLVTGYLKKYIAPETKIEDAKEADKKSEHKPKAKVIGFDNTKQRVITWLVRARNLTNTEGLFVIEGAEIKPEYVENLNFQILETKQLSNGNFLTILKKEVIKQSDASIPEAVTPEAVTKDSTQATAE